MKVSVSYYALIILLVLVALITHQPESFRQGGGGIPQAIAGNTSQLSLQDVTQLLRESEKHGGHVLHRHVGKSQAQLAERLQEELNIPAASSFTDEAEAVAAIGYVLRENQQKIAAWQASGGKGKTALTSPYKAGIVLKRGMNVVIKGQAVRLVLKGQGEGRYIILTGYPLP